MSLLQFGIDDMIFFYFIGNGILVKKQSAGITWRQGSMSLNNVLYLNLTS